MLDFLRLFGHVLAAPFRTQAQLEAEIAVLQHQLNVVLPLSPRLGGCGPSGGPVASGMNRIGYSGYRFPPAIIRQTIWLYLRFTLSLRDVEDLLAERGITVSYEFTRRRISHFGPMIAADLRRRRPKPHPRWHLDEVYLKIDGRMVSYGQKIETVEKGVGEAVPVAVPDAAH